MDEICVQIVRPPHDHLNHEDPITTSGAVPQGAKSWLAFRYHRSTKSFPYVAQTRLTERSSDDEMVVISAKVLGTNWSHSSPTKTTSLVQRPFVAYCLHITSTLQIRIRLSVVLGKHGRVPSMVSAGCSSGILDRPTWRRARPGGRTNIKIKKWVESEPRKHWLPNVLLRENKREREKRRKKSANIIQRHSNFLSPVASSFV